MFADDRSAGADIAWNWICDQQWSGWRVEVATVEPLGISHKEAVPFREWSPAEVRTLPEGTGLLGPTSIVADGDPRVLLAEIDADLLVIGQRGGGLLKKLHIGSVAESLLDCPTSPLLIARSAEPVQHVLLAVDGSTHAQRAAHLVASMPWLADTHVTILGVDEGDHLATPAVADAAAILGDRPAGVDQRVIDYDDQMLTVNVRRAIEDYLSNHQFDLLAVGTKGLHGVQRLRLGSVADYLAHHAPCSVLLTRDPDA